MPPLPNETLAERAHKECAAALQKLFTAPVFTSPVSESCEWSPLLRRHFYKKSFVVWHEFDTVEIAVADDGRIASFRDKRRAEPKTPPELVPLSRKDVLAIAATTGCLGPGAAIDHMATGPKNMLVAVVTQQDKGFPACLAVTINPEARQVAAFDVIKF
jgi:hypothetical protein